MMVGLQGSGKTTTSAKLARLLKDARAQEGADGLARRAASGGAGATGRARPPDRGADPARRRRASARSASPGAPSMQAKREGYDVRHPRHRRPAPYRRAADARSRGGARGDAVRPRPCSSPTRMTGQDAVNVGKSLRRARRHHRHRADPGRRRCARRRGAVDARRHRQADQVHGHRREARRARGVPRRARRRPHPRHGRRRRPGREGRRDRSTRKRPRSSPRKLQKGSFDLDDLAAQLRSCARWAAWAACMGMLPGVSKIKKQLDEAKIDESLLKRQEAIISLDDQGRAAQSRSCSTPRAGAASPPARAPRCRRSTAC